MKPFVKIIELRNEMIAGALSLELKEKGISHLIRSYRDTAFDGLFQGQKGWGRIEAPLVYKEDIENLYWVLQAPTDLS